MSKLLKATIKRHRPHIVAKMTPENGYDETKHLHATDLHTAGVINKAELDDLQGCIDDLAESGSNAAGYLKGAASGMMDNSKLNDEDFVNSLLAMDGDDDTVDDDEAEDADEKVTA